MSLGKRRPHSALPPSQNSPGSTAERGTAGATNRVKRRDSSSGGRDIDTQLADTSRSLAVIFPLVCALGLAIVIASTYVPLLALRPIIEAIAGRDTSVNFIVNVSIVLSVSFAVSLAGAALYIRTLRKENARLLARSKELEEKMDGATRRRGRST